MVQFIDFEVGVEEDIKEDDEVSDDSDLDSLSSFIDNEETDNEVNFYRTFNNVETGIEETLKAEYEKGLEDIGNFDDISNLCESSEDEAEIDNFDTSAEKVKIFVKVCYRNLIPMRKDSKKKIKHIYDKNELKKVIYEKLIDQLDEKNMNLYLIYKNLTMTVI